jgi:hypothetical protein
MRIWLDDLRPMPEGFDKHVKTAEEAIALLAQGNVTEISLDNDLGTTLEGYDVAKFIEMSAFQKTLKPLKVIVHSANPVARVNISIAIANAERYWNHENE